MMWLLSVWSGFKRLLRIALEYPLQAALIALLCLSAWLYSSREGVREHLANERVAHIATKVGYANAQKVAAALNKKQIARIESEYAAIAKRTESEYETSLANNRAALREWMRKKATKGNSQSAGTSGGSTVSDKTMPDATEALVPVSDLEIAADNYSQLMALIEWARSVGRVDTTRHD